MSNFRIERYTPDLNSWMDITAQAKHRFRAKESLREMAEQWAKIYEVDVRVVEFKTLYKFDGDRGV